MSRANKMQDYRRLIETVFEERRTISPETVGADVIAAVEAFLSGVEQGLQKDHVCNFNWLI